MLKRLHIKNFSLIRDIVVNFEDDFSVITGETGSGKSLMLNALATLVGGKIKYSSFTNADKKTIIEGQFILNDSYKSHFEENEIDFYNECIVRKEISCKGKARVFINDCLTTKSVVSEIFSNIIEIHSQNQSLLLKKKDFQIEIFDSFIGITDLKEEYVSNYNHLRNSIKDLDDFKSKNLYSDDELEFYKFLYDELENANLHEGELEKLKSQINAIENNQQLNEILNDLKTYIHSENGAINSLTRLNKQISKVSLLNKFSSRIESVGIEIDDIFQDISELVGNIDSYSNNSDHIYKRFDLINSLLFKHKKDSIKELLNLKLTIKSKIENNEQSEFLMSDLKNKIIGYRKKCESIAQKMSKKRKSFSKNFETRICQLLSELGFSSPQFYVDIKTFDSLNSFGVDDISFQFSSTSNTALKNIESVASGGEISRIMLCLRYMSSEKSKLSILVFDEIDTGVSGEIAHKLAQFLRKITSSIQVFSITHLPQIASKGDRHYVVTKKIVDNKTLIDVNELDTEQRINEIAKLLSGSKVTDVSISNAIELLNQ